MTKTYKTAVVVTPPRDVWEPIQKIRRQHDRKVRRWMPHITMIYPFWQESELDAIAKQVAPECSKCRSFELEMARFDTFSHGKGNYTVWLKPEPEEPILNLHAIVWTVVSCNDEFAPRIGRFTAHLSVGQVRTRERKDRFLVELQSSWKPIAFRVSQIEFIARGDPPNDVFRVVHTIPLGADT